MLLQTSFIALALSASALAVAAPPTNGDFESGSLSAWTWNGAVEVLSQSHFLTAGGAAGTFTSGSYVAVFGTANRPSSGRIEQTASTVPNIDYLLRFDFGRFQPGPASGDQSIAVRVVDTDSNTELINFEIRDFTGGNDLGSVMTSYAVSFRALGTQSIIEFKDVSSVTFNTDGMLDNISLSPIPEPATQALFAVAAPILLLLKRRVTAGGGRNRRDA